MVEPIEVAEPEITGGLVEGGDVCPLPVDPLACPLCGRRDALLTVGDALYCAGCGYASDGVAGCT